jgi:hypothetical protein
MNALNENPLAISPSYCFTCGGDPCVLPSFCKACRIVDARNSRAAKQAIHVWPATRPTPKVVIEAIIYCVRERGVTALDEPANVERLSRCDPAVRAEINRRIAKIISENGDA